MAPQPGLEPGTRINSPMLYRLSYVGMSVILCSSLKMGAIIAE